MALFLITYVLQVRFSKRRRHFKTRASWFFPLGIVISFFSGLVGATGPVLNPFLLNYGLQKEALVGTKSINSLLMQFTKLTTYTLFGALTSAVLLYGLSIGAGAIVGVFLARRHLFAISPDRFTHYAHLMMFFAGSVMLIDLIRHHAL